MNEDPNRVFGGRLPPQNLEAERAVLGAMMIDVEAFHEMCHLLESEQFYSSANRKIFATLQKLSSIGKPGDSVIVTEQLKNQGELAEVGGASYLGELTAEVPTVRNVAYYGQIVKGQFHLRALGRAILEVSEDIFSGCDVNTAFEKAESKLSSLSDQRLSQGGDDFPDLLNRALSEFQDRLSGKTEEDGLIPPWPSLRRLIHGFRAGEMVVIAARPAMGKTSFALNLILDLAIQQQQPVLMFSLEMTAMQITNNLLCIDAGIDGNKWRQPNRSISEAEQAKIHSSVERLTEAKIAIDDDPDLKPTALRAKARKMKREMGLGAIVIDYLQLMKDDPGNMSKQDGRTQEMSNISRQLKGLAKEFGVPVFALAQLNRGVESRAEKVPRMSDLRESGSIEQDADVVILLNRPEYYSLDPNKPVREGEADIIVSKNRHGDVGTAELLFIKKQMTFSEKDGLQ